MDFCNEKLGTKVTSSQVNSDGYEVENLIATDPSRRSKGFLVERFIKPPVDISFTFPCSVELNCIMLLTAVSSQKSIGIDVFGLTLRGGKLEEQSLGKCYLKSGNKVCFMNSRFQNRPQFPEGISVHDCKDSVVRNIAGSASCFTGVKVRIWRTENGSLVAMGRVSIHGAPARSVVAPIAAQLLAVVNPKYTLTRGKGSSGQDKKAKLRMKNVESPQSGEQFSLKDAQSLAGARKANTCEEHEKLRQNASRLLSKNHGASGSKVRPDHKGTGEDPVPEEFVDGLTFELMTFPILLPSGNTIDKTTLEKHVAAESEWGRAPSDPFTGLVFSTGKQPLPHAQLKARIDRFFLQNEQLAHGRTTGKRTRIEVDCDEDSAVNVSSLGKKSKIRSEKNNKAETLLNTKKFKSKSNETLVEKSSSAASHTEVPASHEMCLSQSLDLALGSLTSYTTASVTVSQWKQAFEPPKACSRCGADSSTASLYGLPCSHLLCRSCAVPKEEKRSSTSKCIACGKVYASHMISRVHQ